MVLAASLTFDGRVARPYVAARDENEKRIEAFHVQSEPWGNHTDGQPEGPSVCGQPLRYRMPARAEVNDDRRP